MISFFLGSMACLLMASDNRNSHHISIGWIIVTNINCTFLFTDLNLLDHCHAYGISHGQLIGMLTISQLPCLTISYMVGHCHTYWSQIYGVMGIVHAFRISIGRIIGMLSGILFEPRDKSLAKLSLPSGYHTSTSLGATVSIHLPVIHFLTSTLPSSSLEEHNLPATNRNSHI